MHFQQAASAPDILRYVFELQTIQPPSICCSTDPQSYVMVTLFAVLLALPVFQSGGELCGLSPVTSTCKNTL